MRKFLKAVLTFMVTTRRLEFVIYQFPFTLMLTTDFRIDNKNIKDLYVPVSSSKYSLKELIIP